MPLTRSARAGLWCRFEPQNQRNRHKRRASVQLDRHPLAGMGCSHGLGESDVGRDGATGKADDDVTGGDPSQPAGAPGNTLTTSAPLVAVSAQLARSDGVTETTSTPKKAFGRPDGPSLSQPGDQWPDAWRSGSRSRCSE